MQKPEFIARQGRQPKGLLGAVIARVMARETKGENQRGLDLLDLQNGESLVDIGCGHGETLFEASTRAELSDSVGIDHSSVMLRRAAARNAETIRQGRLELELADTSDLPLANDRFDKAISVHTVYFWPEPRTHVAEVFRVLRRGGRFVLAYRSTADKAAVAAFPASIYNFPTVQGIEQCLENVGFTDLRTVTDEMAGRLLHWSIATKP